MFWKIVYAILILINIVSYSLTWYRVGEQKFSGWNMMVPFTITFFFGVLLGIVILFTNYKIIGLTILAGILMILGVIGGIIGAGLHAGVSGINYKIGDGLVLSFINSILYIILGPICGRKITKKVMKVEEI
jgi:hypothetical protein